MSRIKQDFQDFQDFQDEERDVFQKYSAACSAGGCLPRSWQGEGQALALR